MTYLTIREREDMVATLAAQAFKDHVLTRRADGSWRCGREGTVIDSFNVFTAPGMVTVWGDRGEFVLRHSDRDGLNWWLHASSRDYVISKIQACQGDREEFSFAAAMAYLVECDKQDSWALANVRAVREAMRAVEDENEEVQRQTWWEAWGEQGDSDPPRCLGPASGPLWLWEMALCFRRLHAALPTEIPLGDGGPGVPPVDRVYLHDGQYIVRKPNGESRRLCDLGEHEMVVNRHQMRLLLERLADLAYAAEHPTVWITAIESASPGIWIHNAMSRHPCGYDCGAVYVERTEKGIMAQLGNTQISFDREPDVAAGASDANPGAAL